MMLQHSGLSLADISCSAFVPCLSPPGSLTLDDFTSFSPIVKDELRTAIQAKRRSNGPSADVSSDGASSGSDHGSEPPSGRAGLKREVSERPRSAASAAAFLTVNGVSRPSADDRGAREEEEEEGEEQDRCCKVSQQEEGENRVSAEGKLQAATNELID